MKKGGNGQKGRESGNENEGEREMK